MRTVKHTVTNKSDSEIKVLMDDGWRTVQPGESVTGVLHAVNNGKRRTLYSVEPFEQDGNKVGGETR